MNVQITGTRWPLAQATVASDNKKDSKETRLELSDFPSELNLDILKLLEPASMAGFYQARKLHIIQTEFNTIAARNLLSSRKKTDEDGDVFYHLSGDDLRNIGNIGFTGDIALPKDLIEAFESSNLNNDGALRYSIPVLVDTLSKISPKNDEATIKFLTSNTTVSRSDCKKAIEAVSNIASKGNQEAIAFLKSKIGIAFKECEQAAIKGLVKIGASEDKKEAINKLIPFLVGDYLGKSECLESLLELTEKGDRETIVLLRHLQQNIQDIVLSEKIGRAIQNLS